MAIRNNPANEVFKRCIDGEVLSGLLLEVRRQCGPHGSFKLLLIEPGFLVDVLAKSNSVEYSDVTTFDLMIGIA